MKPIALCILTAAFLFCGAVLSAQEGGAPVVCIDPGHPSEVNSGMTVQNGTSENHVDWVVAKRLQKLLADRGFKVVMTKSREEQLVRNKARALFANKANAAVMVRLHCDTGSGRGYAVYYPDRTGTKEGVTGPSESVRAGSRKAAQAIDEEMGKTLDGLLKNGGVRGDSKTLIGGKQGALTGSIFSKVPIVTIEMVVLSNRSDAEFIKTEEGQQKMAQAIANGIARFLEKSKP